MKPLALDRRISTARPARELLYVVPNPDKTEDKNLETQLLRAQRLESIGTLASGVAHDLNNIFSPIVMGAELLRRAKPNSDNSALIKLIEEAGHRGVGIVKQVLTFARGIEGEPVFINPSHLIQEIRDVTQRTFPKTIQINGRCPKDIWSIKGDPTQLHQVLLNLAVNARDAMPNGGSLVLEAENFNVDENYAAMTHAAQPGPNVVFRVSDTGAGMSREVMDKIFDPFFMTKEIGRGTGLGLSTTLGIVKSHGGFISVQSATERGTTFKVFLPAESGAGAARPSEMSLEALQGDGQMILVVDDESSILQVTQTILEKHNYRVLCAKDGPEALAIIAQKKELISAVLTDISMPYIDGVALVRAIKRMKPAMKFIVSTGQQETRVSELEELGVSNFLSKPYDIQTLLVAVRDTINDTASTPFRLQ
jgi:two-component system, cell cycle sensor histidine kinase and response regulator CckA